MSGAATECTRNNINGWTGNCPRYHGGSYRSGRRNDQLEPVPFRWPVSDLRRTEPERTAPTSISSVAAGLELIGSSEVSPGDRVTLKIVGGGSGVFEQRQGCRPAVATGTVEPIR